MSYWVGSYIEAGMGTSSGGTAYLPFVFSAPDKATATKNAGAKLLSGPYSTEAAANAWVTAYEKNPSTVHAGSDLPKSPGNPVPSSSGKNGAGTVTGDTPPANANALQAVGDFLGNLEKANTWVRVAKVVIGGTLVIVGVSHLTGADTAIARAARSVPLPV